MLDPQLIAFIRHSIRSIWALELLLLLRRRSPNAIAGEELVRDLRATPNLIERLIDQLVVSGLAVRESCGDVRFAPVSQELERMCEALDSASRERPIALRDAIASTPNDILKNFADAFRFKKDTDE